jgi:hypothetical protein
MQLQEQEQALTEQIAKGQLAGQDVADLKRDYAAVVEAFADSKRALHLLYEEALEAEKRHQSALAVEHAAERKAADAKLAAEMRAVATKYDDARLALVRAEQDLVTVGTRVRQALPKTARDFYPDQVIGLANGAPVAGWLDANVLYELER